MLDSGWLGIVLTLDDTSISNYFIFAFCGHSGSVLSSFTSSFPRRMASTLGPFSSAWQDESWIISQVVSVGVGDSPLLLVLPNSRTRQRWSYGVWSILADADVVGHAMPLSCELQAQMV